METSTHQRPTIRLVYFFYAVSGLISLGYQVCWFRIFVDRIGSANLTFALVVINFIGALGIGSMASRPVTRVLSRGLRLGHPLKVYGALEVLIATAVGLTLALRWLPHDLLGSFPYRLHHGVYYPTILYSLFKITLATLVIFIPCFFMGVTFPLLCNAFGEDDRFPSALYACNTLGACGGILAGVFLFLPWLGHNRTLVLLMALNFAIGFFFLLRGHPALSPHSSQSPARAAPSDDGALPGTTRTTTRLSMRTSSE